MTHTSSSSPDVVVAGGGVIGVSVAYHLAEAGLAVTLLEASRIGGLATSASSGGILVSTKTRPSSIEAATRAQRRLAELDRELHGALEYDPCGCLVIATSEAELGILQGRVSAHRLLGVAVALIGQDEVRHGWPIVGPSVVGAAHYPNDGQLDAIALVKALASRAAAFGAVYHEDSPVIGINVRKGRIDGVVTLHGTLRTGVVVDAAGIAAADVARMVGVSLDVRAQRGQVLALRSPKALSPGRITEIRSIIGKDSGETIDRQVSYAYRPARAEVWLGGANEIAEIADSTTDGISAIRSRAAEVLPGLAHLEQARAWAGLRPFSPGGPIVGWVGGPTGFLVATAHGGDGIALALDTGEQITRLIHADRPRAQWGLGGQNA